MPEPNVERIVDDTSRGEEGFLADADKEQVNLQRQREEAITDDIRQGTFQRTVLALAIALIAPLWLIAVFVTVIVDGASTESTFALDQPVMLALISSTTAWFGALSFAAIRLIFQRREGRGDG